MATLKDLEALLSQMAPKDKAEIDKLIAPELKAAFLPNPGPQTMGFDSPADVLLYGGSAGGGKTAMMVGAAVTGHRSALILRREAVQLDGLVSFAGELVMRRGWDRNKVDKVYTSPDGRVLKFAGLNEPDDWRKYAGIARDFYGFDEAGEFLEEQVASLIGWLRSTDANQRCRVILASNPPRGGDGQWMLAWFAPWLDPLFDNPAEPGELRWCIRVGGVLEWVDGPGEYARGGETYAALSYTFVPASLDDNPYLAETGYRARLQNLPEPLRSQLLYGDFSAGREDHERQVIPAAWVDAAQARWMRGEGKRLPMTSLGVDVAQGGKDKTVLAPLHRSRFEPLVMYDGEATPDGPTVANHILATRRNDAIVTIDLTGGWGGSARDHLKTHHGMHAYPFVASEASGATTKDGQFGYINLRAEAWWAMREALDPSTGPDIELPPDPRLKAELTTPLWTLKGNRIQVESKDEIRKRLGSSTDRADAVLMAWHNRGKALAKEALASRMRSVAMANDNPLAGF